MAKFSKALVVSKPRSLVPSRTVNAEVTVLPPAKGGSQLATRPAGQLSTRETGTLTVPKKGGGAVVVSNSGTETAEERRKRIGSGELEAMNAAGQLKGLVKASDALLVAAKLGLPVGQVMEALKPHVLSWGNKRKRERLADGGTIHRRLGGTGYGGANNKGFIKGGKPGSKQTSGSAGGGTTDDPFAYVSKKRTSMGDGKPTSPPGGANTRQPLQLGGKAEPLALGDAPKAPRPGRSAAASGFAAGPLGEVDADAVRKMANKAAKEVGKQLGDKATTFLDAPGQASAKAAGLPVVGTALAVGKAAVSAIGRENKRKADPSLYFAETRLRISDVMSAIKRGDFKAAINLVTTDPEAWESTAQQQRAMKAVEAALK